MDVHQIVEDGLLHNGKWARVWCDGDCRGKVVDEERQSLSMKAVAWVTQESYAGAAFLDDNDILR